MGKRIRISLIIALAAMLCSCQEPIQQADIPEELPIPEKRFELNSVTLKELLSERKNIDGLTARIARNIIEFRKDYRYRRVEDLLAVNEIGEKTFLKIRRYFYVNDGNGSN